MSRNNEYGNSPPTIRKGLLQLIFSGTFMKRWNDKLRPIELVEVDKQAHKMIVAWLLYVMNSKDLDTDQAADLGVEVVEGGIFEYFYRLVITDLKPPIFYQIKANPEHYRKLSAWVLEQLQPRIQPLGRAFWDRLQAYMTEAEGPGKAGRILNAAHNYASWWELRLIKDLNPWDEEFDEIEQGFRDVLNGYTDLVGVDELLEDDVRPLGKLARFCGQLRFQTRWSQTPRIPETSVLGHTLIVACYAYFFSMSIGACRVRRLNNFFAGLFHDFPELLTRDIISPVKRSTDQLGDLVRGYELQELKRRVLDPLAGAEYAPVRGRLAYFLGLEAGDEFTASIIKDGRVQVVEDNDLQNIYNRDRFDPKDGNLLKVCDSLAAYIEAYTAVRNGINSEQLQQAILRIRTDYQNITLMDNLHIGALLADFD